MPTQKSYSSSETLKAFDHEQRLHYGGCVTDLVHHEADEYSRQGGFVEKSFSFKCFITLGLIHKVLDRKQNTGKLSPLYEKGVDIL